MVMKRTASSAELSHELCSLAQKVPKWRDTGNSFVDSRRRVERRALAEVIDKLWNEPDLIMSVRGLVFDPDWCNGLREAGEDDKKTKWPQPHCLSQVPKLWLCSWLLGLAKAEGAAFNKSHLEKLEQADGANILLLVSSVTQLPEKYTFPKLMSEDEQVCSKVLHARAKQVGSRLSHIMTSGGLMTSGAMDVSRVASYSLKFAEGKLTEWKHWTGVVGRPPSYLTVTTEFEVHVGWLDRGAFLQAGKDKFFISQFFAVTDAPNIHVIECGGAKRGLKKGRVLETIVDQIGRSVELVRQQVEEDVVEVDGSLLETPQKQAKLRAVELARQKLSEANQRRQAARKMAFT